MLNPNKTFKVEPADNSKLREGRFTFKDMRFLCSDFPYANYKESAELHNWITFFAGYCSLAWRDFGCNEILCDIILKDNSKELDQYIDSPHSEKFGDTCIIELSEDGSGGSLIFNNLTISLYWKWQRRLT